MNYEVDDMKFVLTHKEVMFQVECKSNYGNSSKHVKDLIKCDEA